jgi:polysaccharide export outer membrane protein
MGESGEPLVVTKLTELPSPEGADGGQGMTYRIGALDKLNLNVVNVPELTGIYRLDTTGSFNLPYIGQVHAAGLTLEEVSAQIQSRLRDGYVKDPRVAVNIDVPESLNFTVDGQVNNPGDYESSPNLTLMRAVAKAKGLSEYARIDDVVVFRTVNGQRMAALYDLGAIRRGLYPDPRIYPSDVVVVGDSAARRKLAQFVQILPLLTTPVIVALQRIR